MDLAVQFDAELKDLPHSSIDLGLSQTDVPCSLHPGPIEVEQVDTRDIGTPVWCISGIAGCSGHT